MAASGASKNRATRSSTSGSTLASRAHSSSHQSGRIAVLAKSFLKPARDSLDIKLEKLRVAPFNAANAPNRVPRL